MAGALRPPDRLLARLRWFFLAFVLFLAVTFVPQLVLESDWPVPVRLASALLRRRPPRRRHHAARGRRTDSWAVVLLDLDGFEAVNDDIGHAAGDRVLEVAARRLRAGVRDGDLAGRLGGDEFVVVVHGLSGEHEPAGLVGRLETSLREPVDVGGRTVRVGDGIGTALVPAGEVVTGSDLLARADAAMYRVGRDRREERSTAPVA